MFSGMKLGLFGTPAHLLKNPVDKDARSFHYLVDPLVAQSSNLVLGHLKKNVQNVCFLFQLWRLSAALSSSQYSHGTEDSRGNSH